jgi:hypothetical protein
MAKILLVEDNDMNRDMALVYFASKRKDIPVHEVLVQFAAFIVCFVWDNSYFEGN